MATLERGVISKSQHGNATTDKYCHATDDVDSEDTLSFALCQLENKDLQSVPSSLFPPFLRTWARS